MILPNCQTRSQEESCEFRNCHVLIEPRDTWFRIINFYARFTNDLIIAEVQMHIARFASLEGR